MGKSTTAETLSVHASKKIVRIVHARGEAIGQKKSRFAALVLEWWVAQGCPAVNKIDATTRAEVMAQLARADNAESEKTRRKAS